MAPLVKYESSPAVSISSSAITIGSSSSYATSASSVSYTTQIRDGKNLTCYLAGPMDGCTDEEVHGWRNMLKRQYLDINWLDPSLRTYNDPFGEWKTLVEQDLKDIYSSDALLAYVWKSSGGTSMELVYAKCLLKIPVVVVVNDLNTVGPWINYHADFITDTFGQAYKYIRTIIY